MGWYRRCQGPERAKCGRGSHKLRANCVMMACVGYRGFICGEVVVLPCGEKRLEQGRGRSLWCGGPADSSWGCPFPSSSSPPPIRGSAGLGGSICLTLLRVLCLRNGTGKAEAFRQPGISCFWWLIRFDFGIWLPPMTHQLWIWQRLRSVRHWKWTPIRDTYHACYTMKCKPRARNLFQD